MFRSVTDGERVISGGMPQEIELSSPSVALAADTMDRGLHVDLQWLDVEAHHASRRCTEVKGVDVG